MTNKKPKNRKITVQEHLKKLTEVVNRNAESVLESQEKTAPIVEKFDALLRRVDHLTSLKEELQSPFNTPYKEVQKNVVLLMDERNARKAEEKREKAEAEARKHDQTIEDKAYYRGKESGYNDGYREGSKKCVLWEIFKVFVIASFGAFVTLCFKA